MNPPRRPVHLDLLRIHLPLTGWVSILHRVSGALLFIAFPLAVWALSVSLADATGYARLAAFFDHFIVKLAVLGVVWALAQHFFAGLRHLALDVHWGVQRTAARQTSALVLGASALITFATAWRLFW